MRRCAALLSFVSNPFLDGEVYCTHITRYVTHTTHTHAHASHDIVERAQTEMQRVTHWSSSCFTVFFFLFSLSPFLRNNVQQTWRTCFDQQTLYIFCNFRNCHVFSLVQSVLPFVGNRTYRVHSLHLRSAYLIRELNLYSSLRGEVWITDYLCLYTYIYFLTHSLRTWIYLAMIIELLSISTAKSNISAQSHSTECTISSDSVVRGEGGREGDDDEGRKPGENARVSEGMGTWNRGNSRP